MDDHDGVSLLDAARRLAEHGLVNSDATGNVSVYYSCAVCHYNRACGHAPTCPVPSLPRIVQVLEAAERMLKEPLPTEDDGTCWYCDEIPSYEGHRGPCPWLTLDSAIRGEGVTA